MSKRRPAPQSAPRQSRIASSTSLPSSRLRLMFSISPSHRPPGCPTASASPPSVMMLIVSPSAESISSEQRIDSGIEMATINVERQLPRKIRIITAVRQAAIIASRTTPRIADRTKIGLIRDRPNLQRGGSCASICGKMLQDAGDDVQRRCVARLLDASSAPSAGHRLARYWSAADTRRAHCQCHEHRSWRCSPS